MLFDRFCGVNVDIQFQRNTVGDHIGEMTNGMQRALSWLEGVFGGKVQESGCFVSEVTVESES